MKQTISLSAYQALTGQEVGASDWVPVDQGRINLFADATGDHQFIHVDPERAAATPFGGTIAHGFLTLSLLSEMADAALPAIDGTKMAVNYGLNSLRFLAPVRSGKRIRGRFVLADIRERSAGAFQTTMEVTVEIEGESKPALVAEWVTLAYL